ncbi:hypothetical protein SHI21_06710 [Bacteriovorax sp. PP10]|uniref:DUF2388 domain-containing protein n=1 Tax=Bacteriovorax antarcticus TaxID=3088717 RepID=A0ABU5VS56_9BACT|nr:hypothetical protein [Bacteriovorax sp. PP10]MEA9355882.1 hypothetical protein [Bacteriovorax sp. PP10]
MKMFLIALTLISSVVSTQTHAAALVAVGSVALTSGSMTSYTGALRKAEFIANDGLEYYNSGTLSPELADAVRNVLEIQPEMSQNEAVDLLMNEASDLLK